MTTILSTSRASNRQIKDKNVKPAKDTTQSRSEGPPEKAKVCTQQ